MVAVSKIDSNATALAYAKEQSLGVLPGSPVWKSLEPNTYSDFGGEFALTAPNPINNSRQARKGVITDLSAAGGFNHNLTFFNLIDLFSGLFFALPREKGYELVTAVDQDTSNPDEYEVASTTGFLVGSLIKGFGFAKSANNALNVVTAITTNTSVEVADGQLVTETPPADAHIRVVGHRSTTGDLDVTTTGDYATITSTTLNFTTLGLVAGQWIFVGGDAALSGFTTAANNGFKRIRSISANALVIDKSALPMQTEANTTAAVEIYFGDVLKNELAADIVRTTYQIERILGAPDTSGAGKQSEYLIGAVPNEFSLNIPTADLVNTDWTFLAIDYKTRKAVTVGGPGPLQSGVIDPLAADVYNTSSDFSRMKMSIHSITDEAPTALFAFVTEATITINNNVTLDKAVSVLGAFDMTPGTFQVGGSITAYFASVDAIEAIRNNSNITFDCILAKQNHAIVFDLPLIALGGGRLNVEINQAVKIPLTMDAATAKDIDSALDYTALMTFFYYTPTAAE